MAATTATTRTPTVRSATVRFLGARGASELIRAHGVGPAITAIAGRIGNDYRRWDEFDKCARVPAHGPTGVIEVMPIADAGTWAFKYVNGHPGNAQAGLATVVAFGALARMADGRPYFIADLTLATALRTAATSALVARHLARPDARVMAMIGNGAQSEFQILAFAQLLGIRDYRLFDIDPAATARLRRNLARYGLDLQVCRSVAEACAGADIITTATADKTKAVVVDAGMVAPGTHLNAIGGDSPGKTELAADLVAACETWVEFTPQTRIEGEIQQLPATVPVNEIHRLLRGEQAGRRHRDAITLFDSVGFALEDFSVLHYLHDEASRRGLLTDIDLIPAMNDPRDLFGCLHPQRLDANAPERVASGIADAFTDAVELT